MAPWESQEREDPFSPRQGTGTRNFLLGTFSSKQRKIRVSQTQEPSVQLPGDLPPGSGATPRPAAFSVSGRVGLGLSHSSERSRGVQELSCRPAVSPWAGTSHTGASRPRPTGRSKGRGPPPEARGTCRLYCLLENPNALGMSESLKRDLLPWFSQPFPVTLPPKTPLSRQTSEPRCCMHAPDWAPTG